MRVERRGKVEIIRLRRKQLKPKQRPCFKRFLKKLKIFSTPKAKRITADELINLILKTFGSNYKYHILISDEWFNCITKEQMQQLLKKDDTDQLNYIPTIADCDDYSDVLLGSLTKKTWTQGFAIGQLWYFHPEGWGHAINVFCDGEKIWCVEPQNDQIIEWGTGMYKGKCYMIKF